MARSFTRASSQYLIVNTGVLTGLPLSMACWFNTDDLTVRQVLLALIDNATNAQQRIELRGDIAGDFLGAGTFDGATIAYAISTAAYSANTWHHVCALFTSSVYRAIYLDGANKGENANNKVAKDFDDTGIGLSTVHFISGAVAEAAFWNVTLTDAEVAVLAEGYSPLFVRPQSLAAYYPLIQDTDADLIGGHTMTPINAPTVSAHPRLLYPSPTYTTPTALTPSTAIHRLPLLGAG